MNRTLVTAATGLALLAGIFTGDLSASQAQVEAAALAAPAPRGDVEIDKAKIRFGRLADFDPSRGDAVGTVRSRDIYLAIPAYRRIVDERIDKDSALGRKLMREATKAYNAALKAVAQGDGYVLIVEEGGIRGYPTTDVTDRVIEEIPAD